MAPQPPPRRFAATPIETSSKSSRQRDAEEQESAERGPRSLAVEHVEDSSATSKGDGRAQDAAKPAARKFAVQPVESSSKSSRKPDNTEKKCKPKSRFAPEPIETSTKSSRKKPSSPEDDAPPSPISSQTPSVPDTPGRRRFAPQLIDTATRTRKSTDPGPTHLPTDKTDITPSHALNTGLQPAPQLGRPHELRRERSPRGRSDSRGSMRSHSFRCPDLETIESSESEPSNPPSLSNSPSDSAGESPLTSSDVQFPDMYNHATRRRESADEAFSRYLLELESRRAEQKLQEQALAAFPNSDFHEPVQHYVDEEDDASDEMEIDDRPATWDGHDDDGAEPWELQELQRHHEQQEQERNAGRTTAKKTTAAPSPWWKPPEIEMAAMDQGDPELRNMRDQARPPMLGADIDFPRSASPEPARFDVTQGSQVLRSQMCYLTEQSQAEAGFTNPKSADGLWLKSSSNGSTTGSQSQGLWGGFCVQPEEDKARAALAPPTGPTGLMTPALERPSNPFDSLFAKSRATKFPPTPPNLDAPTPSTIDGVLDTERELDALMAREYPETFITQVYNYLSLGYPSLAQPFDEELAKIAQVTLAELRADDAVARSMPKGYIRLGDDFQGRGDGTDQGLPAGGCARWRALQSYVREWARQEKDMVKVDEHDLAGNWGAGPRRGSWAW